ncbi:substrate-binding domain-containing protein [Microbacterium limosum]|jgi:ribose transport system substrate-binding protein|uniref:Substrate-binding domain-containing protein n=1 Tax=Microbacterium limosum TaxID=3079935 RepID=A0AAU0MDM7_9MICO|nr:substrate-binding domain-containing protein [Microbacterium sp. Y20]WOQ68613.1 substrate-binding domain-containing protein [Microbacterium sp. Y20]
MKIKKTLAAAAGLAVAATLALTGCSSDGGDPGSGGSSEITIGISMSTLENPFFGTVKDGAVAKADEDGIRTIVSDAQNDTQKQLNDVQDMITKGATVIILNPVEPESATPIVELANSNDIPVITVDRSSAGGDVASHIASDNVEGGRLICDWLGKKLNGQGQLAVLEGIAGTSPELDRDKGCKEALANYPGIETVASQPADWDREKGYTVTQNILQANPDLNAIFGRNDLAALGAVEAAQQAGKLADITVISFDGIQDALESIKAGQLSATVVQDPILMGETAVNTAVALAAGESVDKIQNLAVKVADATNIDEFLK